MHEPLTDEQRESCAVSVMRTMLTDYCDDKGIPFEQIFFEFSTSLAYKMLFDYSTGLWKEGPDYLRNFFESASTSNDSVSVQKATMTEREIDIADMQCWVFRMAQSRWKISPTDCSVLFKKFDIFGYIVECYDLVCTYSYSHVVDDAEAILAAHSVFVNDIQSLKQAAMPFISEEEMNRRLGINEDDLVGFEDVELE